MIRISACFAICCAALTSCGVVGKKETAEEEPGPFGPTGIPPALRGAGNQGSLISPGGNTKIRAAITPDSEMVFTDPDNPDAPLPELSSLLTPAKKGSWEESETIARQRASREGKPLLIWFTDSGTGSPMSKALNDELFLRPDFEEWAKEKIIRLRVDATIRVEAESMDEEADQESRRKTYVADLKKRYKVLGQPTLVMLNPSGEVIGKYRGYKRGDSDFTWGLIKQGEVVSSTAYKSWRGDLEKKGYREWQDTKGRKVFAKLLNYHEGKVVFMEPDGTRSQTNETKLSAADRSWINQQKAQRGIQ